MVGDAQRWTVFSVELSGYDDIIKTSVSYLGEHEWWVGLSLPATCTATMTIWIFNLSQCKSFINILCKHKYETGDEEWPGNKLPQLIQLVSVKYYNIIVTFWFM